MGKWLCNIALIEDDIFHINFLRRHIYCATPCLAYKSCLVSVETLAYRRMGPPNRNHMNSAVMVI